MNISRRSELLIICLVHFWVNISMHLYKKHQDLYEQYPKSMAVMNRRMGKRVHPTDPALAAKHFKKSLKLSKNPYDLKYWIMDSIRSSVNGRERKVSE